MEIMTEVNGIQYYASLDCEGGVTISRMEAGRWMWSGNGKMGWRNLRLPADFGEEFYDALDAAIRAGLELK